jgi:ABC-type oligopeptide transport system ATPase subunit
MGQGILIIGESGSGKSTSIESLDPKSTFIINVANKGLPFKGWKKKYTIWSKDNVTGNMYDKATPLNIEACIRYVNEKRPEIKTIVIDDFQYMSSFEFFERVDEKGYEKFTQIGAHLARIARLPKDLREDLQVYFLTHAEESTDMEGKKKFKAKTIGKMVDEKLTLEGLFSIVLFGKVKKNKDGEIRYVFETQNNGENTCKSPRNMFPEFEIANDLDVVRKAIIDYEN